MSGDLAGEVPIKTEGDIVVARRTVRETAAQVGFALTDVTRIVTAASELARNVYKYGGGGMMFWRRVQNGERLGLELKFVDQGPGIVDIDLALQEGYSTGKGLGLGLPAAKRLMDDLRIQSAAGAGTTVISTKWRAK